MEIVFIQYYLQLQLLLSFLNFGVDYFINFINFGMTFNLI